jgi:formate dehydrogenase iron-sulfur subunit
MRIGRRFFLKSCAALGAAGAASALPVKASDAAEPMTARDGFGVLVDTTQCLGCRACEVACAEANGNPEPDRIGDDAIFTSHRETSENQFTVVNKATGQGDDRYAKSQCLHCIVPACASACPVKALDKTDTGPVIYHKDRCIGCRYCMVACPFGVPKYEYDKAIPYVRKCTMCFSRLAEGKQPACVENCAGGALQFGKRSELLLEAKKRVYAPGSKYLPHIYGENEAGGTSWLYISDRPFSEFGFPEGVGDRSFFENTRGALGAVPLVMTLWPPLLMGLYAARTGEEKDHE